jgi:hypothetical protein
MASVPVTLENLGGDSTVEGLAFRDGAASLRWTDGDSGKVYLVEVPTTAVYSEASKEVGSAHVRLVPIAGVLAVDPASGLYCAPAGFGEQMKLAREGFHLAIGLKAGEFSTLLQVRGYKIVLACPIRSSAAVKVVPQ